MDIEWDRHIEYLHISRPLRAEPGQTLVAIVLPDLAGLPDRVLTPPKEQIDKIAHQPTNATKSLETHPQSPIRSQLSGKPVSKENTVVLSELQEIHKSQVPQEGDILTAYGKGTIDPKPGGLTIVLMRYERRSRVERREK